MIFETKFFEEYQYLRNLSLSLGHPPEISENLVKPGNDNSTKNRILEEEILGDERSDRIILAVGRLLGYAGAERGATGLGSG